MSQVTPSARRTSTFAIIRQQRVFIEIDGHGPFIIMTHGLGASTNVFQPLMDLFSSEYTVVRFDWPGSGMSGLTPEQPPLSVPGFVEDLEAVMKHLEIRSAVLVGHSLGGIISMHIAAKRPHLVRGLVVIGAGRTRAPEGSEGRDATIALSKRTRDIGVWPNVDNMVKLNIAPDSPALARALMRQVTASTNAEGYAQTCDALTDASHVDPDYSHIKCPTCLVASRNDPITSVEVVEELRDLISQSGREPHLEILETGHMQIIEDVGGVAASIRKVL